MWTENEVLKKDLVNLCKCDFIPWEKLNDKTVLITGATGLVGYNVACALLYYYSSNGISGNLCLIVRDVDKARKMFYSQLAEGCNINFIVGSVEEQIEIKEDIDYIIHCACPTASHYFVSNPVDTMETILEGTRNMLKLAKQKRVSGMIHLSSMEVFGEIKTKDKLKEEDLGYINPFSPRSSYPEAKRFAESLCCAYANQYHIPVTVARLAQTFGPGVKKDDGRVFAYIARCAMSGEDIRLNTSGAKENMYVYTMDAVSAILLLLLNGARGEVYNVGSPKTYCSVKKMAELVATQLSREKISVITNTQSSEVNAIYPPETFLNMDISKLESIGWTTSITLQQMFKNMMQCF